ncbi:hypothetical protein AKJ38_00270 [candidate division MSBL1 archaeon SCGC-AAA259I14]|uniref:Amidohydrolase-related domain-containing protein n=1 Tax=candidate division MSBL1 archaeon SCGC-AAA259I14 TaxID=1698268 RepID=A0A133UUH7_9EURY|nr:hypothetical protein AKJ38_00270 [candidate division MSBL1 archaeon SCGC-AAA259I14]
MAYGKYVIPVDEKRKIIEDGGVVYEGDKIVDVGDRKRLEKSYEIEEKFGGEGKVIIPGLINTHSHLQLSIARGFSDGMNLMELKKLLTEIGEYTSDRLSYLSSLISLIELVKNGVTTTLDIDPGRETGAEALAEIKSRGIVSEAMRDRILGEREGELMSTEEALKKGEILVKRWNDAEEGRIKAWFGPYTELLTSLELLERTSRLAEEYNTGIHIHLAESFETQSIIKREYGKRIFEYAKEIGFLGSNVLAAHCCWLSEKEIKIISEEEVKVSHSPVAEMKLADGVTPVPQLLSYGVNVSTSTDAPVANNGYDLLNDAKVGALLQRVQYPYEAATISPWKALEMITIEAAKSLLLEDEIGSLEKGKQADITILDIDKPYYFPTVNRPCMNILENLIFSGSGRDVETVIIDGNTILEDREVQTLDEEKVKKEASRKAIALYEELNEETNFFKKTF